MNSQIAPKARWFDYDRRGNHFSLSFSPRHVEEREKAVEENGGSSSNLRLAAEHWCACTTTHHRVSVEVTNGKSVNLGKEGRREDEKTPRSTLYTALILDSNGCSRVVAVLVIASRLHTARVQRNVSPVDDNVAVAEGVLAAFHLSTSGGVTLYFRIPKRPLVNSMGSSSWWQLNGQYNKRGNNCERIFQNFEVYTRIIGYFDYTLPPFRFAGFFVIFRIVGNIGPNINSHYLCQ